MTINERFEEIISKIYKGNKRAFAIAIGVSPTVIENVVGTRKGKPSYDVIEKICVNANISPEWLITGKGDMIKTEITKIYHPKIIEKEYDEQYIPLYNLEAVAGLKVLFDNNKENILDLIKIPHLPKCDGAVYVTGDSMYPLLKSGDIVLYKQIQDIMSHIYYGEMYLLSLDMEGDEYVTVKYLHKSDLQDYIKLVSYNHHHEPKDIPIKSIKALALIKASIRMNTMS